MDEHDDDLASEVSEGAELESDEFTVIDEADEPDAKPAEQDEEDVVPDVDDAEL
jgi:hypothetical protein